MNLILKVLLFAVLWSAIYYLAWVVLTKVVSTIGSRDFHIRLMSLYALSVVMVAVALYMYFLIRHNGILEFKWAEATFYLSFLPQLLVFLLTTALFFVKHSDLTKTLSRHI